MMLAACDPTATLKGREESYHHCCNYFPDECYETLNKGPMDLLKIWVY